MSNVPMADLVARMAPLEDELIDAVTAVLRSGRYILGPNVAALEAAIAERCGVSHGVGVSSGTDALLVAMMALDIGPGDEVVTTPLSFFATAGAIARLGATPVFADIDAATFNLDASLAAERVGEKTKAVETVHLFGQCADVEPLREVTAKAGAAIIEDAAQAIGATRGDKGAGALGGIGCFSFFPTKNLGAIGDGGMVVTENDALADRVRMLRAHGARPKYYHHHVGGNFRLDEIQAACLMVMLPHLDEWNTARRENAQRYDCWLADADLTTRGLLQAPARDAACEHIFHQYVIRVPEHRDDLRDHLSAAGIGAMIYYPVCLHEQPCFAGLGYSAGDFPIAEQATREVLALPIHPEMTIEQQHRVVDALKEFFA